MRKEQQAKDIAKLVTRLAQSGDIESLRLLDKVFSHVKKLAEDMCGSSPEVEPSHFYNGMTAGNCTVDNWVSSCGGGGGCSKLNVSTFTHYRGSDGRSERRKPLFIGDGYSLLCIKCKDSEISNYRDFFYLEILAEKDKTLSLDDILSDASRFVEDGRGNRIPLILGENCRIDVVGNL